MNILFVNHNISLWVNVGLSYVMSACSVRHRVKLVDRMRSRRNFLSRLRAEIRDFAPDIIAFSVNSFTQPEAAAIARRIKEWVGDVTIIFGGIGPTLDPENSLRYPAVDAICVGEGELAFSAYADARDAGNPAPAIAGMWIKNNAALIRGGGAPFIADLEALPPPDWSRWDIDAYLRDGEIYPGTLRVLTSRGCPFRCAFCSNPAWLRAGDGPFYRTRAPEHIVAEINDNYRRFHQRGFSFLMVSDSIFGLNRPHAEEFCGRYRDSGLHRHLAWGAQMRCGTVDYQLARQLRRAGCRRVTVSIESGNDYLRNTVYKKNLTREQIIDTITALRQAGIVTRAFVMIGGPEETPAMFAETLTLAARAGLSVSDLIIIRYAPLPHTELAGTVTQADTRRLRSLFCYRNAAAIRSRIPLRYFWWLRLKKIICFVREATQLTGAAFWVDLLKVMLAGGKNRFLPLLYLCSEQRLINWTLVRYKTNAAAPTQNQHDH